MGGLLEKDEKGREKGDGVGKVGKEVKTKSKDPGEYKMKITEFHTKPPELVFEKSI